MFILAQSLILACVGHKNGVNLALPLTLKRNFNLGNFNIEDSFNALSEYDALEKLEGKNETFADSSYLKGKLWIQLALFPRI